MHGTFEQSKLVPPVLSNYSTTEQNFDFISPREKPQGKVMKYFLLLTQGCVPWTTSQWWVFTSDISKLGKVRARIVNTTTQKILNSWRQFSSSIEHASLEVLLAHIAATKTTAFQERRKSSFSPDSKWNCTFKWDFLWQKPQTQHCYKITLWTLAWPRPEEKHFVSVPQQEAWWYSISHLPFIFGREKKHF